MKFDFVYNDVSIPELYIYVCIMTIFYLDIIKMWNIHFSQLISWLELMSFLSTKVISGWQMLLMEETGSTHEKTTNPWLVTDNYPTWWRLSPGRGCFEVGHYNHSATVFFMILNAPKCWPNNNSLNYHDSFSK